MCVWRRQRSHKCTNGFIVALVVVGAGPLAHEAEADAPAPPTARVVILGTGTPNADPDRSGPSVAVVVGDTGYLVDCGPGVVRRAAAAHRTGIEALEVSKIKHLFVTHLHSDHTLGFADLIFSPWVLGRGAPLEAYGPPGLAEMTEHLLLAYAQDRHVRVEGLEPINPGGYGVNVHEIADVTGPIYRDANVTVTAFPVSHGSWEHAFGYAFQTADKTIVISGDTKSGKAMAKQAMNCDILVHEVYSSEQFQKIPPVWQRYHSSFHTSTTELAAVARVAKPRLLVLYHQLYWGATDEDLVREVRSGYTGNVTSARDLDVFE